MEEVKSPIPVKEPSWEKKLGTLDVGEFIQFPKEKRPTVSNIVSARFHALSSKRFSISTEEQPEGVAIVWRVA